MRKRSARRIRDKTKPRMIVRSIRLETKKLIAFLDLIARQSMKNIVRIIVIFTTSLKTVKYILFENRKARTRIKLKTNIRLKSFPNRSNSSTKPDR
jgi:hypothetical protein